MAIATKTAPKRGDLSTKTKTELQFIAEGKNVPFNSKTTKEELVKGINKAIKNSEKQLASKPTKKFAGEK